MKKRNRRSLLTIVTGLIATVCLLQSVSLMFLTPESTHYFLFDHRHTASDPILLPLQHVWQNYQRWHSQQALEQNLHQRKFQVVYYSCPQAAGNLLHDFFNQVLVAVALNRTMLWKYNDPATCNATRKGFGTLVCLKSNTEADCARSLKRVSWLPSWDEWAPKLQTQVGKNKNFSLPIRDPHAYSASDWQDALVVAHKPMVYQTKISQLTRHTDVVNGSRVILNQLYSSGEDVLFGMLFRKLFQFQPDIIPAEYRKRPGRTFAIHSRHFTSDNLGEVTRNENQCLRQLLPKEEKDSNSLDVPCTVFILSDRQLTIDKLSEYINRRWKHCTPVVATHIQDTDGRDGHYLEHGPHAGAGFLQDLMVGSQARDGFIGHCYRSSSQLLREFIQYDRLIEALRDTGEKPRHELTSCCLPST